MRNLKSVMSRTISWPALKSGRMLTPAPYDLEVARLTVIAKLQMDALEKIISLDAVPPQDHLTYKRFHKAINHQNLWHVMFAAKDFMIWKMDLLFEWFISPLHEPELFPTEYRGKFARFMDFFCERIYPTGLCVIVILSLYGAFAHI